jgi:AcrR family transcriptional regulator
MDISTKEKIMDAAIVLFSEKGYETVSMRDIARTVGIKAASIYNHYPSKRDILESMYEFYRHVIRTVVPDEEKIISMLETEPLQDVLASMLYYFPPELQNRMDRILLIASQRISLDKDSELFVREQFFEPITRLWRSVLDRAIELGRIEPLDTDSFVRLIAFYAFSAAELNSTVMKTSLEQWQGGLDLLYSLLKPVNKNK